MNNGLSNPYVYYLTADDSCYYAGTDGGGVFISTDHGGSWNKINQGLINTHISSFAVKGRDVFCRNQRSRDIYFQRWRIKLDGKPGQD